MLGSVGMYGSILRSLRWMGERWKMVGQMTWMNKSEDCLGIYVRVHEYYNAEFITEYGDN